MSIISTRRFGRMGNALYMYANVIALSKKFNIPFHFPTSTNNAEWNPIYFLEYANPNWVEGREDVLVNEIWNLDQHFNEISWQSEWNGKQVNLNGYWQSFKYFDWCKDEVLKVFNFPYNKRERFVSVHIRRGDYLNYRRIHPVVTYEYLDKAIQKMIDLGFGEYTLLFHSDDIEWAKEYASTWENLKVEFSEGKDEIGDLISMVNCEHQICSNSTLATWGAELNRNPNKIVIVPSENNWFGIDNQVKFTIKDMFRPEWIQISYIPVYELPLEEQVKYKLQ